MTEILSNLTNGARMAVTSRRPGFEYILQIPKQAGAVRDTLVRGSTIEAVVAELDTIIAIKQRNLNAPVTPELPSSVQQRQQSIDIFIGLRSQFSSKAAADTQQLQAQITETTPPAPAPTPAPPPPPEPQVAPEPTPDVTGPSETDTSEPRTISEPETTTDPSIPEDGSSTDEPSEEDDEDPGVDSTGGEITVEGAAANTAAEQELRAAGAEQDSFVFQGRKDWRVRLALSDAPEVNYLYRAPNPGILQPLNVTGGVIFPYTPTISVNYTANYNPTELVHSNYKVYQYSSSSIDSITIACDFTAQSISEADYLLAVIHFFRSATKMFYGQDENPRRGTPPPLCYIYGMGSYQFAGQPLAISQFSYNLPNNVDYIKTSSNNVSAALGSLATRLSGTGAAPGGKTPPPSYIPTQEPDTISWVPSKIQLSITCVPMLSRNQVSNRFSLQDYASGALLNGIGKPGGGFW
jgi:outer membrane biosynthesis protein TonB